MDSDGINKSLNTLSISESSPSIQSSVSIDDITLSDTNTNVSTSTNKHQSTENPPVDRPPPHNVTEKIIFCLDSVADINTTAFKINDYPYSSLSMFKRSVEIFVLNKSLIDAKHEFAVMSFDKRNVRWNQELSSIPRDVIKSLDSIYESDCQDIGEFDLSTILEQVWQTVKVPKPETDPTIPPPYIVRLILLYSRNCVPVLKKDYKELLVNPYFVTDVILTHEEKSDDKEQQDMFHSLCIDEKVYSYKFAVGTNASVLHESMAKLLAHPLQRSLQDQAVYKTPIYE